MSNAPYLDPVLGNSWDHNGYSDKNLSEHPPITSQLIPVRKLEHRSYFSLIFSPMDIPFSLSPAMFPLHVEPNRLYSPPLSCLLWPVP